MGIIPIFWLRPYRKMYQERYKLRVTTGSPPVSWDSAHQLTISSQKNNKFLYLEKVII